jgi:hypothetical protein
MKLRAVGAVALVLVVGCQRDQPGDPAATGTAAASATPKEEPLDRALAEKLLLEKWSTRLGVGAANCLVEIPKAGPEAAPTTKLGLAATGETVTLRGTDAERCMKSLAGAHAVTAKGCDAAPGAAECTGSLVRTNASAYCEPTDDPCRIIFACGQASVRDLTVDVTGHRATMRLRVAADVDVPNLDGCPAARRASEDRTWTAKATFDGGQWSIDGMPETP